MSQTYTARYIFPVAGPPLERGTITIDGDQITSVDAHGERPPDVDLGNVAIIPGLVNAHTHLDLSGARGKIPPTDPEHFCDWLMGVIEYRKTRTAEQVQADIREGLAECMNRGTTLVGDIAQRGISASIIGTARIRAIVYWEIIGLSWETLEAEVELCSRQTFFSPMAEPNRCPLHEISAGCKWGISPHSPYSVRHDFLDFTLGIWGGAVHIAETPGEVELLESRTGPYVTFLQKLGVWNPDAFKYSLKEMVMSRQHNTARQLYIHGNYLDPSWPIPQCRSIVYCPRTHAAFKHPPHPFREFLARGVNVALGTDSLASNPDLDLFEEARFVYENRKDVPPDAVLKMATVNGAKALGWADECGTLEAGKSADFVAMPLPDRDGDAWELLFASDGPRRTMFQGRWRE